MKEIVTGIVSYKDDGVKTVVSTPEDVMHLMQSHTNMASSASTELWVVGLTQGLEVVSIELSSKGSADSGTSVVPKNVFRGLIACNASGFIAVCNRPSGNIDDASGSDTKAYEMLKSTGDIMQIPCLDMVLISPDGESYYSFKEGRKH